MDLPHEVSEALIKVALDEGAIIETDLVDPDFIESKTRLTNAILPVVERQVRESVITELEYLISFLAIDQGSRDDLRARITEWRTGQVGART